MAKTSAEIQEYMKKLIETGKKAQKEFETKYTDQRSVDEVINAIGRKVYFEGEGLAQLAVDETGMGNVGGKLAKFKAVAIKQWNFMKGKPSVGYLPDDPYEPGVKKIAKPMGIIGCVMPSTNPIATVVGNSMMALKCRNSVIIAPHPQSAKSSLGAVDLLRSALKAIGAPEDLVQCIDPEYASIEATDVMLHLCDANIATGGAGMVKAVYSAGRPAFGVGQGNCQDIVDDFDDYEKMAKAIIANRAYDVGVPCTGDQTVIIPESKLDTFIDEMVKGGAYHVNDDKKVKEIEDFFFPDGGPINRAIVGKTPEQIGKLIGLDIPEGTPVILLKNQAKGTESNLCREILCPVVRYTTYKTFEEAVDIALTNLEYEGAGHSSSIWSFNDEHIKMVADKIPVGRFHINQPTLGSNNGIPGTITIGCGTWGNNSISENLEYYHLMNLTRVSTTLPNIRPVDDADWDDYNIGKVTL